METNERRLGWYLVLSVSLLITFTILSVVYYFTKYMIDTTKDFDSNLQRSVSSLVFNNYSEIEQTGDFTKLAQISDALKKNDIIKYIYIVDRKTNKLLWSDKNEYAKIDNKTPVLEIRQETSQHSIVIGYVFGALQTGNAQMVLFNTRVFVFAFLLFGFILSILISNIVSKPIMKLINGVQEFSKGNFDHQLEKTKLYELNELIEAYNEMAKQLKELYSSLEIKVQERTEELEKANKQLKETQAMMVHSEKMRSLGELVAGIAHEINNPINFIYGNIIHLERYSNDLFSLIEMYEKEENCIAENKI